jgi:hypothetical protein
METFKNSQLNHSVNSKNPLLSVGLVMFLLTSVTEIVKGLNYLSCPATRHFDYFFLISPHFLYTFSQLSVHLLYTFSQPSVHLLPTFCALPPNFLYTSYTKPIHFVYPLYRPRIYQRYTMDTPRIPLGYQSNSSVPNLNPKFGTLNFERDNPTRLACMA